MLGSLEVLGEVVDGVLMLPGELPSVPSAGFVCSVPAPAVPGAGMAAPGAGVAAPGVGVAAPGDPATPPGAAAAPPACPAPPAPAPAACPKAMDVHNARVAVKSNFFIFANLLLEFLSRTQWSLRDSGHGHRDSCTHSSTVATPPIASRDMHRQESAARRLSAQFAIGNSQQLTSSRASVKPQQGNRNPKETQRQF